MSRPSVIVLTAVVLLGGLGQQVHGQPAVLAKFEEAQDAARSLALYPKDVRDAILEVAQHPDLVAKLIDEKNTKGPALEKTLAVYPADVRKAARVLVPYPEVLKTINQYPALTALVGRFYSQKKAEMQKLFDKEEKTNSDAVDAWTKRLGQNPQALDQLLAAADAYAKQLAKTTTTPPTSTGTTTYSPTVYAGVSATPTAAAVYALPTGALAGYALANANQYPALADEIVNQWINYANPSQFEDAASNWWQQHSSYVPEHVLDNDGKRPDRLADLAKFDKLHPIKKDQPVDKAQQQKLLQSQANDYPALSSKLGFGPMDVKGGPATVKNPMPKPTPGPAPRTVQQKPPTQQQQVQHAAAGHNGAWQKPASPPVKKTPKPAPGGRRK